MIQAREREAVAVQDDDASITCQQEGEEFVVISWKDILIHLHSPRLRGDLRSTGLIRLSSALVYTVYVFLSFTSVENSLDFPRNQVLIELSRFPALLLPHPQ